VSGTPAGWSPVPYESAQLSVPGSSWLVESPQQLSCGFPQIDGMIFVGVKPAIPKDYGCNVTASLAWILPAGQIPKGIKHSKPTAVINGIPVYRLASAKGTTTYLAPELGVRVGARGKLAARVLATLTRSPLSVVLRPRPGCPGARRLYLAAVRRRPVRDPALVEPAERKSVGDLRHRALAELAAADRRDQAAARPAVPAPDSQRAR
jgi:hypothetical protein